MKVLAGAFTALDFLGHSSQKRADGGRRVAGIAILATRFFFLWLLLLQRKGQGGKQATAESVCSKHVLETTADTAV